MEQSTQWGVSLPNTFPMKKHLKSRNPALNIPRRHEAIAIDTVFSDTPAVDSGVKQAQVFVGRDTLVADAYDKLLPTLLMGVGFYPTSRFPTSSHHGSHWIGAGQQVKVSWLVQHSISLRGPKET